MEPIPVAVRQYYVFVASPNGLDEERHAVRRFFERWNRNIGHLFQVRFEVIDSESYASIGLGRPQELITRQTLERFRASLALVIGIMGQRFGSPTGTAESGTEEEFRWALDHQRQHGFPEIKWYFRTVSVFVAPPDVRSLAEAVAQWEHVIAFRQDLQSVPAFIAEYPDSSSFTDLLAEDLGRWLANPDRPWVPTSTPGAPAGQAFVVPRGYYELLESDFARLDIAGIDNDRAFEIPLSEIYVKLRVLLDEDDQGSGESSLEGETIDIQSALARYQRLAIVGDPGSGKSTFLKYVALVLSRSVVADSPQLALEKLSIQEPLPLPVVISCWELAEYPGFRARPGLDSMLDFLSNRLSLRKLDLSSEALKSFLMGGGCFLLVDGLDEVPTDAGRSIVSRVLEDFVKEFPKNRYVVTSRVRAYSGDTILRGGFSRCDIQPFDSEDRETFLRNWTALLFRVPRGEVSTAGTEANRELVSVTRGIEENDRIRPLAVNPLLLTVIAIVHWNRKRLPEQRVDLYDECVDVLLGQRKEAERVQSARASRAFDVEMEDASGEERPWVRKRFAEIALAILERGASREEAAKTDVVTLLVPRFVDKGAKNREEAAIQASRFLEKQELRSGLLVSRREGSYRFVHLTFQEYLAAWHLSNLDFDYAIGVAGTHLREQRWFETLQLLGGEWAKQSDEKLERYLAWLLDRQGTTIVERSPVIALCANIVRDTRGSAEVTPETRARFRNAVKQTLDAFRPRSGVPAATQLEILEALGQLGASVKPNLIDATRSSLFQVRSRAIQMLLPFLSDDELFGMDHILEDRSRSPIRGYIGSLLVRDPARTLRWLGERRWFPGKATDAVSELLPEFGELAPAEELRGVLKGVFERGDSYAGYLWYPSAAWPSRARLLEFLSFEPEAIREIALSDREPGVRSCALRLLVAAEDSASVWEFVRKSACEDRHASVRGDALTLLVEGQLAEESTEELVRSAALESTDYWLQLTSLHLLVRARGASEHTWDLIGKVASDAKGPSGIRVQALELLREHRGGDDRTWMLFHDFIRANPLDYYAGEALKALVAARGGDSRTLMLIGEVLAAGSPHAQASVLRLMGEHSAVGRDGRILLSKALDGRWPMIDLRQPIDGERLQSAAAVLKADEAEVRRRYERLAEALVRHFGVKLLI